MSIHKGMLPAVVLAAMMFTAPQALAQNATSLSCKKCVDTGDIAKKLLGKNAVNSNKIADGQVKNADLGDGAVGSATIQDNAVTRSKIGDGTVPQSKLEFDVATQDELDDQTLKQRAIPNHMIPKMVFVTSDVGTGNLGGLAGADALCQAAADHPAAVVPPGEYVAWLSTDSVDARDRITKTLGPYVRTDGAVIAKSYAGLLNTDFFGSVPGPGKANLISPIGLDQFGDPGPMFVWTGTSATGIRVSPFGPMANCDGWTSSATSDPVWFGNSTSVSFTWTNVAAPNVCANSFALYCFQK